MTALATDSTLTDLLAATRSDAGRDCDTTHLVLADRLDDLERGEWAEFVRNAVELERTPEKEERSKQMSVGKWYGMTIAARMAEERSGKRWRVTEPADGMGTLFWTQPNPAWLALRSRQRELETRLRMGAKCEAVGCYHGIASHRRAPDGDKHCPACRGTGHAGTLGGKADLADIEGTQRPIDDWSIPVVWSRGLPVRITAPLDALWNTAGNRPSEWAIAVQREWCGAVGEMVAGDQEPEYSETWELWYIRAATAPGSKLRYKMGKYRHPLEPRPVMADTYGRPTPELATRDFARAIADLAREG